MKSSHLDRNDFQHCYTTPYDCRLMAADHAGGPLGRGVDLWDGECAVGEKCHLISDADFERRQRLSN